MAACASGIGTAGLASVAMRLGAQSPDSLSGQTATNTVQMNEAEYKPVKLPAKPNAKPVVDAAGIDELEHAFACPCPCTLDVYTCRRTMFNCGISPAVHGDVEALVAGGYSADEIMKAMTDVYGDYILVAPRKQGYSLIAWAAPFVAVAAGAVGVSALLRSWRRNATRSTGAAQQQRGSPAPGVTPIDVATSRALLQDAQVDATPEELAALDAALRDDRR